MCFGAHGTSAPEGLFARKPDTENWTQVTRPSTNFPARNTSVGPPGCQQTRIADTRPFGGRRKKGSTQTEPKHRLSCPSRSRPTLTKPAPPLARSPAEATGGVVVEPTPAEHRGTVPWVQPTATRAENCRKLVCSEGHTAWHLQLSKAATLILQSASCFLRGLAEKSLAPRQRTQSHKHRKPRTHQTHTFEDRKSLHCRGERDLSRSGSCDRLPPSPCAGGAVWCTPGPV